MFLLYALLTLALVVLAIELYQLLGRTARSINQFAGPKGQFLLGHIKHILVPTDVLFNNFRRFAKDYYPIYKLWSSHVFGSINIVGPDDLQIVLSNVSHNEKSNIYLVFQDWLGEGLLTSGGEKWQKRRKILTPTFHFKILKQFVGIFDRHSEIFAESLEVDQEIDINPYIHKCSLHMIAEAAMGTVLTNSESDKKYREAIHDIGAIVVHILLRPWMYFKTMQMFTAVHYKAQRTLKYLKQYTKNIIDEREKNFTGVAGVDRQGDDVYMKKTNRLAMLDLLLQAKRQKEINDEGIREEVDTFMFEGHDTISMAMSFCYMLLACNKQVQDRIYEELSSVLGNSEEVNYEGLQRLSYMEMAIKESLRLYPSVPLISRVAGEDFTTSTGHHVCKGTIMVLHIYDVHHNAELYPDPERFDPERFSAENSKKRHPYAYLPFSAGSRNCIGQKYAMLSMKSMLVATLRRFELYPVDTPQSVALHTDIILRTKGGIRMKLKPREKVA